MKRPLSDHELGWRMADLRLPPPIHSSSETSAGYADAIREQRDAETRAALPAPATEARKPEEANMHTVIPLLGHPRTRERVAGHVADMLAERLGLADRIRAQLVADTRALVRRGCSAAWAIRTARRTARKMATMPEGA